MGSNPGYLLKSFLLYQTLLWWKQIKCIHVKIESRCKLRNKLIEKLVFCRALQKELHPSSVIPDLRVFMVSHPSTKYFNTKSKLIEYQKFTLLCIFAICKTTCIFNLKLGKIHSTYWLERPIRNFRASKQFSIQSFGL